LGWSSPYGQPGEAPLGGQLSSPAVQSAPPLAGQLGWSSPYGQPGEAPLGGQLSSPAVQSGRPSSAEPLSADQSGSPLPGALYGQLAFSARIWGPVLYTEPVLSLARDFQTRGPRRFPFSAPVRRRLSRVTSPAEANPARAP